MANNCSYNRDLISELENNIGRLVTVFTEGGSDNGNQFTGLLVSVEDNVIRLITSTGRSPLANTNGSSSSSCPLQNNASTNRSDLSTVALIPVNKITSVVFNQL